MIRPGLPCPARRAAPRFALVATLLATLLATLAAPRAAFAVPSFAEQTGQPCAACHVGAFGPQLKPYGRDFKIHGYVANDGQPHGLPIAATALASFTHTAAAQAGGAAPGYRDNDNLALDQLSLFYAGRLTPSIGAFAEATIDGAAGTAHFDNLDVRAVREGELFGQDITFGVTVNDNPTVSDAWNSTPVWGFPYNTSTLAPTPAAATLVAGALAQRVAGAGVYAYWNNLLYAEADAYVSPGASAMHALGIAANDGPTLRGAAPYGRLALVEDGTRAHLELGGYGLAANVAPAGGSDFAASDRYVDAALDATFQYMLDLKSVTGDMISVHATAIREWSDLAASRALVGALPRHDLATMRADVSYSFQSTWTPSAQLFRTEGTADPAFWCAANGGPGSSGAIFELAYVPWGKPNSPTAGLNAQLAIQYVDYFEFNGSRQGASRNNAVYASLWVAARF